MINCFGHLAINSIDRFFINVGLYSSDCKLEMHLIDGNFIMP